MVPRTAGGKRLRDAFARLPLTPVLGAMDRLARAAKRPLTLPEYAPAPH
jgi:hypothetical protein